jgi:hypothetical protein
MSTLSRWVLRPSSSVALALALAACGSSRGATTGGTTHAAGSGGATTGSGTGGDGGGGGATTGSGGGATTGTGTGGGPIVCHPDGFKGAPATFALPPGYTGKAGTFHPVPFEHAFESDPTCATGEDVPAYSLLDVDGDGKPDLVVTRHCNDAVVGASKWLVYRNTGSGFAPTATDFALPPGYSGAAGTIHPVPFEHTFESDAACAVGQNVPAYSLLDVDGDKKPDLVVTQRCNDTVVGAGKWLVYRNTGSGFAPTATDFALPPGYSGATGTIHPVPFEHASESDAACAVGQNVPAYTLLDVDGDHRPDLLVTQRCNDAAVGDSKWLVYANTGSGFAPTATDFALPPGYSGKAGTIHPVPFEHAFESNAACAVGQNVPAYSLLDVDGDHRPDLLVTQRCNDAAVGDSKWLVYANTGSGFAPTATDFALPPGYSGVIGTIHPVPFEHPFENGTACSVGQNVPAYSLLDVDGDDRPDLVITQRCNDTEVGATRWLLHQNTGSGFATASTDLALPTGYSGKTGTIHLVPFEHTFENDPTCDAVNGEHVPAYTLSDLDGDGRADLVMTARCADAATGQSSWLFHQATCAP